MSSGAVRIGLLYVDGCPNHRQLAARMRELLDRAEIEATIEQRRVCSDEEARRLRFLGSPTIRVDGRDVEPGAEHREDWALTCRLYRTAGVVTGMPGDEMILAAIERARGGA
jgi:hypothetical protein